MVKKKGLLVFALGAMMAMGHMSAPTASSGMKEFAEDYAANKGVGLHVLRAEGAGFEYSKTFVQSGVNEAGEDVLRFATAVKGEVESLSYTRFALEGAAPGSAQAMDNVVPVTTLYKSIEVSEGSAFYDGEKVVNDATEATEGWYWACYSITYTSSTFKASDVRVQLTVNESEALEERSTSLNKVKLPNFGSFAGKKYSGSYVDLDIVDEYTASCTYSNHVIKDAVISDYANDYYELTNDLGESFKVSFTTSGGSVTVREIVYLKDDGSKSTPSSSYYADQLKELTSFYMTKSGNRVDTRTYEVQAGDYEYLTIVKNPSEATASVSYSSSDNSKVTVSLSNSSLLYVEFKAAGEAKITVTLTDAYGNEFSQEVKYNISEKIFPTEDNWVLEYDKDLKDIKVGNQVKFSVKWLDDSINTDQTVTWSSSDSKFASINKVTGVMEAKKETEAGQEVTITASVTGKDKTTITKSVSFSVAPADEGALPDKIVGVWEGQDDNYISFTVTVKADGSATLETEEGNSWDFIFDHEASGWYYFAYEADESVQMIISVNNSTFELEDETYTINDYETFCALGTIEIKKQK
ncbi:MAG: Ig-like domain-containing protein [Erysipelotrichales bacterium]|nr:Ig-like domain-containing protein [Erysipelotrichales bacterium]